MAAPRRSRAKFKKSTCCDDQERVLLCTWWKPKLDEDRLAALNAPKTTRGYSPALKKREPERFVERGSEIQLIKPYTFKSYRGWWLNVAGKGRFYAYEAELERFSEVPGPSMDSVGEVGSIQQIVAERMSEMGMPTDAPTVSRTLDKFRRLVAPRFAEHFGRPITGEYLAKRARTKEFRELLDEALEDLGEVSQKLK